MSDSLRSVLISINPKWCELIASGKKTVEVRRTRPKLETPFKCYIYCTQDKYLHLYDLRKTSNGEFIFSVTQHNKTSLVADGYLNGKVIGEFVCDRIDNILPDFNPITKQFFYNNDWINNDWNSSDICLSSEELNAYGKGKPLYGWHFSALKIYDKPKELLEFWKLGKCPYNSDAGCNYKYHCYRSGKLNRCGEQLTKPPQSWCYVQGVTE